MIGPAAEPASHSPCYRPGAVLTLKVDRWLAGMCVRKATSAEATTIMASPRNVRKADAPL